MKLFTYLTIAILYCTTGAFAQTKSNILDELNTSKSGEGNVVVYVDDTIKAKLGRPNPLKILNQHNDNQTDSLHSESVFSEKKIGTKIRCTGYKVQVFSGNNQRISKDEAYSKQNQIKNMFPNIDTVVSYHSPFWKLRAGNFKTREEATEAMLELKKAFPSFGREMYVVRDQVTLYK